MLPTTARRVRDKPHVIVVCCLAAQLAALVPWLFAAGAAMDEGALLAYGNLVFRGYVPGRDLRSFYGPLNSYVVGAVLWVSGGSFYAERALGLAYQLVIAGALLLLVRHRGLIVLVVATGVLVLLPPENLDAAAVRAAVGATLAAIVAARAHRAFWAGALAGVAVLMRYDWALPVALAAVPWLLAWPRRSRIRSVSGFAAVSLLYVPYLAVVGTSNIRYAFRLLHAGESGRRSAVHAITDPAGALFYLTLASLAVIVLAGIARRRTNDGRVFLSVALMTFGVLPYVVVTPDRNHVLTAALPPIVCAVAGVGALWSIAALRRRGVKLAVVAAAAASAPVIYLTVSSALPPSVPLFPPPAHAVALGSRTFLLESPEAARAAEGAVRLAAKLAPRRGRLFVGPRDLRDTRFADAYFYFLLPWLRPATFFVVLDPGTTDIPPHRLSADLSSADVLILDSSRDADTAASVSGHRASSAANRVVARDFCLRGRFRQMLVYQRCGGSRSRARAEGVAYVR